MNSENSSLAELREKFQQRLERIRHDDDSERERHSTQLREIMETMYEVDMVQRQADLNLKAERLAQLKESYAIRKSQREQIIENEFERFTSKEALRGECNDELFAFERPPGTQLQVISDKTENGTRKMKVHAVSMRRENRSVQVAFINEIEQSRESVIDGRRIEFTVVVPESRVRTEIIQVHVPWWRVIEIEVPTGEDWEEVARQKLVARQKRWEQIISTDEESTGEL